MTGELGVLYGMTLISEDYRHPEHKVFSQGEFAIYSDPAFHARLASQFEGDFKLNFHLAPPLLSARNERGELKKRRFGPWVRTAMAVLAHRLQAATARLRAGSVRPHFSMRTASA